MPIPPGMHADRTRHLPLRDRGIDAAARRCLPAPLAIVINNAQENSPVTVGKAYHKKSL